MNEEALVQTRHELDDWMDDWKVVTIAQDSSVATTRQAREENTLDHDTASHLADLAANGSTVAIAHRPSVQCIMGQQVLKGHLPERQHS